MKEVAAETTFTIHRQLVRFSHAKSQKTFSSQKRTFLIEYSYIVFSADFAILKGT
jgi:hypothetical protein